MIKMVPFCAGLLVRSLSASAQDRFWRLLLFAL